MKKLGIIVVLVVLLLNLFSSPSLAEGDQTVCAVYFTGIGCPHCAQVDPFIFDQLLKEYPQLVIIEYEIYQDQENAPLIYEYNQVYDSGLGIPLIIFGQDKYLVGDRPIIDGVRSLIEKGSNPCPLIDGTTVDFEELDFASLSGKPKIWPELLNEKIEMVEEMVPRELTLAKVISLAAVDAVNPCALAVLVLMLLAIITLGPKKKRNVLVAGLAFSSAVLIMYFLYGLAIIKFFQIIQALANIRFWLYKALGMVALVLGVLNIKDFIYYQPGGFLTEMPMFLRPKAQSLFFKVTNPWWAFVVGALVTVFLLPCTIGPYVICGGVLCSLSFWQTIPWLLLYNLIFILPMLVIVAVCYLGLATVENVADWKEKNIRYLHLVAGLIIFGLGIAMILGWV